MLRIKRTLGKKERKTVREAFLAAKAAGLAGVSPFLEEELNAGKQDSYFFRRSERSVAFFGKKNWNAFASVFYPDRETAELTGFYKKEGCTGAQYAAFLKAVAAAVKGKGIKQVYVVGNPACEKEKKLLTEAFGQPVFAEYFMSRENCARAGEHGEKREYRFFLDGRQIGAGKADFLSAGWYLHGIVISPDFREKGFGTRFLQELLRHLKKEAQFEETRKEACGVFLQVSSKNVPAVRLYKKLGFFVTQERDYYCVSGKGSGRRKNGGGSHGGQH